MRRSCYLLIPLLFVVTSLTAGAASGKVLKVLPHFLDGQGRHSLTPSLYDRDAYQEQLRKHPEQRSGIRFDVLWHGRSEIKNQPATLRIELRGSAKGNVPSEMTLATPVTITGTGHWAELKLVGESYKNFGEVTAWRATLWVGDQMIGEQKSFLW